MLECVFFDLDGTLLPMDQEVFVKAYFGPLCQKVGPVEVDSRALIQTIWQFIRAAAMNGGKMTNEELFWQCMQERFGEGIRLRTEALFDDFYQKEFYAAQTVCGYDPRAKQAVDFLKEQGITPVLATNPIFPAAATHARIQWAGLEVSDFCHITTMENSTYAKPDPAYYGQLLQLLGLKAENCLMVGNDIQEDGAAAQVGMTVFFLTDCLIDRDNTDLTLYPHGGFDELLEFLKKSFAPEN